MSLLFQASSRHFRLVGAAMLLASIPAGQTMAQGACSWENSMGQPGMNNDVWALHEYDGEVHAGGRFSTADGQQANGAARWNGDSWLPLSVGIGGVSNPTVHALTVFDDGTGEALYAGGTFTTAGGETAHRIARWNGESWSALGEGLGNSVRALAVFDDGGGPALYAGGTFQTAGGQDIVGIARWNGVQWSALGEGLGGGLPFVYALTVFDDGDGPALYVGGTFITAGGESATNIARWDGTEWSDVGGGVSQWVTALTVFDDGSGDALYAGGAFGTAGGKEARRVARWDGEDWSALGSGVTGDFPWVEALTGFDDGTGPALYVGGWFEIAGGEPANRIARWDGENWSPLGAGLNERVWDLKVFDDGNNEALYVAGHFTAAGGQTANRIARWVCEPPVATEGAPAVDGFALSAFPNPSAGNVSISFTTTSPGTVRLTIYDLLGREVAVMTDREMSGGSHTFEWDARNFAPGVYVVRLTTDRGTASQRLMVTR